MRPLGQIFLKDTNYIRKISSSIQAGKRVVVEIGPGRGAITDALARRASFVYCVEIDKNLCTFLRRRFKNVKTLKILCADILKTDMRRLGNDLVVCGNIPYYLSSELIGYIVRNRRLIRKAYFTVQKEFARRLMAQPGDKFYGYLSCYIQYYAGINKLFDIPKGAFLPHPKVDSSFLEIDFHYPFSFRAENEKLLFEIIRKSFLNRRKKVVNSLKKEFPALEEKIKQAGSLSRRPQELSLRDYVNICRLC